VAAVLAVLASACGPRTLVLIGSDRCADGGAGAGCPDPCADGGIGVPGCVDPGLLGDLIGYWQLDDGSGSTMANDLTGRNHGTLVDLDPATSWVAGRAGGAMNIAAAGFANVVSSPSINSITDQVTISGWGYLDGAIVDEYATIASRQEATTIDQHYHIGFYRDGVPTTFIKTENRTSIRRGPAPAPIRTWVHLASTYDGSIVRFYIDGQEVMNEPLTGRFVPDTTPFVLGGNGNAGEITERFAGRIDEIMLYRRALSAGEIAMLHAGALLPPQFRDGGARD
jgi:hypothetical protein